MPELYVIAGPNGAGKSTYSAVLVPKGTEVFDGDKELAILQARFAGIDDAVLLDSIIDRIFPDRKQAAISGKKDFAFETNFATDAVMQSVKQFKNAGYETNLIYIGLDSVGEALERVNLRVKRGGHSVTPGNILSNYEEGLKNVQKYLSDFHKVLLMDNSNKDLRQTPRVIYSSGKSRILHKSARQPDWFKKLKVPQQSLLLKKRPGQKRGKKR